MGGIRHTTGDPDRPPARCGISLGDSLASLFAVVGTLAALHERSASGLGQEVDVAIYEAVAALMESTMADYELAGVVRGRSGGTLPGVAPANAYPTGDGHEVLIAANADGVFAAPLHRHGRAGAGHRRALRHPHGARRPRDGPRRPHRPLDGDARAPSALLALLAEHGVPAGRVYTAPDMLADPHYLAREMVLRVTARAGFDLPITGVVPRFSRTPGGVRDVGPTLGEHTEVVTAEVLRQHESDPADGAPPA